MYSTTHTSEESHPLSPSRPRPWSPDPRDPVPSLRFLGGYQHQRHDLSDPSIDAFDLADYARTLNRNPYDQPYPYDDYLSSPPPTRTFSLATRTSSQPPSLVSSRGTPTSHPHSTPSHRDIDHRLSTPIQSPALTSVYLRGDVPYSHERLSPFNAGSSHDVTLPSEIDITHFPSWSHGWYAKEKKWSPIGQLHEPSRASFFDPAYPTVGKTGNNYDAYAAASNLSSRDFVPWSDSDTPDYDSPMNPELKQERVRMLEHEFGSTAPGPVKQEPIGSVNEKGRLITDGPRKRTAIRAIEVFLALGIAATLIYAALVRRYHLSFSSGTHDNATVDQTLQTSTTAIGASHVCALCSIHPDSAIMPLSLLYSTLLSRWSEEAERHRHRSCWPCGTSYSGATRRQEKEGKEREARARHCPSEPDR